MRWHTHRALWFVRFPGQRVRSSTSNGTSAISTPRGGHGGCRQIVPGRFDRVSPRPHHRARPGGAGGTGLRVLRSGQKGVRSPVTGRNHYVIRLLECRRRPASADFCTLFDASSGCKLIHRVERRSAASRRRRSRTMRDRGNEVIGRQPVTQAKPRQHLS